MVLTGAGEIKSLRGWCYKAGEEVLDDMRINLVYRNNFKICCKEDVLEFINSILQEGAEVVVKITSESALILRKERGVVSCHSKTGDLMNQFNPSLELASTSKNSAYRESVEKVIWRYMKYINKECFSGK